MGVINYLRTIIVMLRIFWFSIILFDFKAKVWYTHFIQIGDIRIINGNTLDEQIAADKGCIKILWYIERLDMQAQNKKFHRNMNRSRN